MEAFQSVDDSARTAVSSKEIRALFLHRQLSSAAHEEPAKRPSVGVLSTLSEAQPRYAPWLKKALARAEHSKNTWSVKEAPSKAPNARKNTVKYRPNAVKCSTIWEASERGNVEELRRLLEANKTNVFARNENDGGKTILHYACFHVHLNIVMYITMYIQATKGLEALRLFVNCIDTAYNRCTPLLEACMTLKGNINDKLKILKLLVLYGATLEHQDAHGDNALHWSVRNSCLPIVRYLVKETDAAVFAVITDNFKLQKPLDVAKHVMDKKPTMNSVEVYNLLRLVYRECNIRLKIQYGKKIRLHNEAEIKSNRKEDTMQALDNARIWTIRSDALWNTCHDTAEATRNAIESKFLDEAGKEAVGKAQLWLETKDGKAWMKKELPNALDNLKNLVQDGTLPKPRDLKRAAAVRLCEAYISTQENEMRDQMRKKFMRENPPLDSREVEYYKRMTMSKIKLPKMSSDYALHLEAGLMLSTASAIHMPSAHTYEFLVRPPLYPKVPLWLLLHKCFGIGVVDGFVVLKDSKGLFYQSSERCAIENIIGHWCTMNASPPVFYCNGVKQALLRLSEHPKACPAELLDTLPADELVRIGWSRKPHFLAQANIAFIIGEVRLWKTTSISLNTLDEWRHRELSPTHPFIADLVAYWRLNNQSQELVQEDLSGNQHDFILDGFKTVHWTSLQPLTISEHPCLDVKWQQAPVNELTFEFILETVATEAIQSASIQIPQSLANIALVVDAIASCAQTQTRWLLALTQFVSSLPASTTLSIMTTLRSSPRIITTRLMDSLGKREALKQLGYLIEKPVHEPSTPILPVVNLALEQLQNDYKIMSSLTFGILLILTDSTTKDSIDKTRRLYQLLQPWCTVHVLSFCPGSIFNQVPPRHTQQFIVYEASDLDIEFILAHIAFTIEHMLAKHFEITLRSKGCVQVDLDSKYDAQACVNQATSTGRCLRWIVGPFVASDKWLLSGRLQWSAADADECVEITLRLNQSGTLQTQRSLIILPPYLDVLRRLGTINSKSPSSLPYKKVRFEAKQAQRLYEARLLYLEHLNNTSIANAQKSFEKVRAEKETQANALQDIVDEVSLAEQRTDLLVLIRETIAKIQSLLHPPPSPKRKFTVLPDADVATQNTTNKGAKQNTITEWVESIAFLIAKANVEEADSKLDESLHTLRQIDDELRRKAIFITDTEIKDCLALLLVRIHETQLTRKIVISESKKHVFGSKKVLLDRMAQSKEKYTENEREKALQVFKEFQKRLDLRKEMDTSAFQALKPALNEERLLFLRLQLSFAQARFADILRERPIPDVMLPFATMLIAPCSTRVERNALNALVYLLRNGLDPEHKPLCRIVHDHISPIWWADEQLMSYSNTESEVDDQIQADDCTRLAVAQEQVGRKLVCTSNAYFLTQASAPQVSSMQTLLHLQLEHFCTNEIDYNNWKDEYHPQSAMTYTQWCDRKHRILSQLPQALNETMLDLSSFECDECHHVDDAKQLLRSPCYNCSYYVERNEVNELLRQINSALNEARCQSSPSSILWKFHPPTSALAQLRKSYADRFAGAAKERHGEAATKRLQAVNECKAYLFERYDTDLAEFNQVRDSCKDQMLQTQLVSTETLAEYNTMVYRFDCLQKQSQTTLDLATHELECTIGDIESRTIDLAEIASTTEEGIPSLCFGIQSILQLATSYLAHTNRVMELSTQTIAHAAEFYFYATLVELDKTTQEKIDATYNHILDLTQTLEKEYIDSIPQEANSFFELCSVQNFKLSSSIGNSFDLEWLQRAIDDIYVWEEQSLQAVQNIFFNAHELHCVESFYSQVQHAICNFHHVYAASSDQIDTPPLGNLSDVVWLDKECGHLPTEIWLSLDIMMRRTCTNLNECRFQYLRHSIVSAFLQAYVNAAHQAWQTQCIELLDHASQNLTKTMEIMVVASTPRVEAQKAYRIALEDENELYHQRLKWSVKVQHNTQVRSFIATTILQLRHIATVQSEVEGFARQHNRKETKPIWDKMAAYQGDCFADGIEQATLLDQERERLEKDGQLLEQQAQRCRQNVSSRKAAWESSAWDHTLASLRLTKAESWLHKSLEHVLLLERKRQRDIECQIALYVNGLVSDKESKVEFADGHLIQSAILRLEVQKQARLDQLAYNRMRLLERLLRQEIELLEMTKEEAERKDHYNTTTKHRCEFIDNTHAAVQSLGVKVATKPKIQEVYAHLKASLATLGNKSWLDYMEQTAAFAENHWDVQHRLNCVEAISHLYDDAKALYQVEHDRYSILYTKQTEALATPSAINESKYVPLDTIHLMLYLNAKAAGQWARQVNMKRTGLHEVMHLKKSDMNEWAKVDKDCSEYTMARKAYITAENDLVYNRFEIKLADTKAAEGSTQCQQYVLSTVNDKKAVFLQYHPDPKSFDCDAMISWSSSQIIYVDMQSHLQRQLRQVALGFDLREFSLNWNERLLGGDLPYDDIVAIYGRPKRLERLQHNYSFVVLAAAVAKYSKRWVFLKHCLNERRKQYHEAKQPLKEQSWRLCIEHALSTGQLFPELMLGDIQTSCVLSQYMCTLVDWQLFAFDEHRGIVQRLLRSITMNQANLRSWTCQFAFSSVQRKVHDDYLKEFAVASHSPPVIVDACINVKVISSTSAKITWTIPENASDKEMVVLMHLGQWKPASCSWKWQEFMLPGMLRHTLTALSPSTTYCFYLVLAAANGLYSPIYCTKLFTTPHDNLVCP